MSRRIVFAGGAQARSLFNAYRLCVLGGRTDTAAYIGPVAASREAGRAVLAEAEIIVLEVEDTGDVLPESALPAKVERLRFPHLTADFLWPFAGRPHPQNRGFFPIVGGPYPAEHGDSFLDRLAEEGVEEDEAVARYLALDIAKAASLDERLSARLSRMRKLDDVTGFATAELVEGGFRNHPLFLSRERPSRSMTREIAATLFRKLGEDPKLAQKLRISSPSDRAQPLHPGVIRHFGLTFANADTRYPMNDEGRFTFTEYCHRYWRFEWNEPLHRGIKLVRTNPAEAIAELDRGLAWSPDSAAGQRALKQALAATGQGEPPEPDAEDPEADAQAPEAPRQAQRSSAYVGLRGEEEAKPAVPLSAAARASGQDELIETLPEMLPSANAMADAASRDLASLPELMPPPPLRPVLPPELPGEPPKKGFLARLLGR